MWGYQQAHISLRLWRCENVMIQASTHEPDDMRMHGSNQGYMNPKIWGSKDVRIPTSAHQHENMRIQGYNDQSKLEPEDMKMRGCEIQANKYEPEDMRVWECKDTS